MVDHAVRELKVGDALGAGWEKLASRTGLQFVGILAAIQIVMETIAFYAEASAGAGPQLSSGILLALFLAVVASLIATFVVTIGLLRAMVRPAPSMEQALFARRVGPAFLSMIGGVILTSIIVGAGLVLFVIPGIYIGLGVTFWMFRIAVEDEGVIEALQASWDIAGGHRWKLLALTLVIVIVTAVLETVPALAVAPVGLVSLTNIVAGLGAAISTVYTISVLADAYGQLTR